MNKKRYHKFHLLKNSNILNPCCTGCGFLPAGEIVDGIPISSLNPCCTGCGFLPESLNIIRQEKYPS